MKKLLLGLLLLPGLVVQAEEPVVQPEMSKKTEQAVAHIDYLQELKDLLEKEKAALLEGVEENVKALQPLIEETKKVLRSTQPYENVEKYENIEKYFYKLGRLQEKFRSKTFSFCAKTIRSFSNYSADKAAYLGLNCYHNLTAILLGQLANNADEVKAVEKSHEEIFKNVTQSSFEELGNCIRANEQSDKEKDDECFSRFGERIAESMVASL